MRPAGPSADAWGRDVSGRYCRGQIADADFLPPIALLHLSREKLKHVKLLPGSIKTQEGQAVKAF